MLFYTASIATLQSKAMLTMNKGPHNKATDIINEAALRKKGSKHLQLVTRTADVTRARFGDISNPFDQQYDELDVTMQKRGALTVLTDYNGDEAQDIAGNSDADPKVLHEIAVNTQSKEVLITLAANYNLGRATILHLFKSKNVGVIKELINNEEVVTPYLLDEYVKTIGQDGAGSNSSHLREMVLIRYKDLAIETLEKITGLLVSCSIANENCTLFENLLRVRRDDLSYETLRLMADAHPELQRSQLLRDHPNWKKTD